MRWISCLIGAALAAVQPVTAGTAYDELPRLYAHPRILTLAAVPVCFDHGCAVVKPVRISDQQWQQVIGELSPPADDAVGERGQIRRAVARMEQITGVLAGTASDRGGNLVGLATPGPQMDCIDESSNTTTYLTLLEQYGLLRWHSVEPRAHRGYMIFGGWPHFAAVIRDRGTGHRWVVDSWFHDNGQPPEIVDIETWQSGWEPRPVSASAN